MTNSVSLCLQRVRAKKVNCFTNRRLTNKTTIANKVIFKKSLLNSAYNNLSWKVNDSDAKTVSSICSVLLRSAGNFPKKGNDVVLSIDEVSCAFNKKAGECSGRLGGLQEQYAHNRIQSVQYNQPEEEQKYTGSDESHLDVSELDKENMNLSRRRNTVCSTTFKSLKNRGLMELGQANKNKDENLMKNSNLDNSKSIADPVAGLMQFRKLTMKKNIHLSIESKHNPWRKDRVI
ncbi:unnamed protein product [Heterobilharzia americana]|nr:unnamed protein product [Heterobilharzia americana]